MKKLQIVSFFLFFVLLSSSLVVGGLTEKSFVYRENNELVSKNVVYGNDDFYFVHITDTHVMNKVFDHNEFSKKRFRSVLDRACSFENKPAFIVITGDLTQWGGSGISGALNCQAFTSCLYKKDDQFYADANYSIPVYTTPGNHEYNFNRNLRNYYKIIDKDNRYVVNYSDVSLFFINSGPNYYLQPGGWFDNIKGGSLYNCDIDWLEDALNNCNSNHKIVLMHHPAVNFRDEHGRMNDVIAHNRARFVELCEDHDVDIVLAGHTHYSRIFDGDENFYYDNTSLNCSLYPTLFVQTDDCKDGVHYRNVSVIGNDIWIDGCVKVEGAYSSMNFNLQGADVRFEHLN
ncbi:MAG: metallophosphoesterase [Euryarchaeota archaeon]|nr:metallophosphoesterase [Euryarchaeota archaeon]